MRSRTDSKAGSAISRVLVRKNVLVRMGTPRFMLKGDEITLPVIVHNYLDTAKQANVSLKVAGAGYGERRRSRASPSPAKARRRCCGVCALRRSARRSSLRRRSRMPNPTRWN